MTAPFWKDHVSLNSVRFNLRQSPSLLHATAAVKQILRTGVDICRHFVLDFLRCCADTVFVMPTEQTSWKN